MWALLFVLKMNGQWFVAYDDGVRYQMASGHANGSRQEAFDEMATLRGQSVNGIELR